MTVSSHSPLPLSPSLAIVPAATPRDVVTEVHPAAELFPMMEGADLLRLAADIKHNGLREPIVVWQGRVLDGRNRRRACQEAGVEPTFVEWDGNGSPVAFVLSRNLHRRHLNESQRAVIAARAKEMFKEEAEARTRAHQYGSEAASLPCETGDETVRSGGARTLRQAAGDDLRRPTWRRADLPKIYEAFENGLEKLCAYVDAAVMALGGANDHTERARDGLEAALSAMHDCVILDGAPRKAK